MCPASYSAYSGRNSVRRGSAVQTCLVSSIKRAIYWVIGYVQHDNKGHGYWEVKSTPGRVRQGDSEDVMKKDQPEQSGYRNTLMKATTFNENFKRTNLKGEQFFLSEVKEYKKKKETPCDWVLVKAGPALLLKGLIVAFRSVASVTFIVIDTEHLSKSAERGKGLFWRTACDNLVH